MERRVLVTVVCLALCWGCKDNADDDDLADDDSASDDDDTNGGLQLDDLEYGRGLLHLTVEYWADDATEGVLYALDTDGDWRRVTLPEQADYGTQWAYAGAAIAPDGSSYLLVNFEHRSPWLGIVRYDGVSVDPYVASDQAWVMTLQGAAWGDDGTGYVVLQNTYHGEDRAYVHELTGASFAPGDGLTIQELMTLTYDGHFGWLVVSSGVGDYIEYGTSVFRFEAGDWTPLELPADLDDGVASCGCGAGPDRAWVHAYTEDYDDQTHWVYEEGAWSVVATGLPWPDVGPGVVCLADGTAWGVDPYQGSARYFDGQQWSLLAALEPLDGTVVDLSVTDSGDVWILTTAFYEGGPLYRYRDSILTEVMPVDPFAIEGGNVNGAGIVVR